MFLDFLVIDKYIHTIDDETCETLKIPAEGKFCKLKKREHNEKGKNCTNTFWRSNGKFQILDGKLHYDGKKLFENNYLIYYFNGLKIMEDKIFLLYFDFKSKFRVLYFLKLSLSCNIFLKKVGVIGVGLWYI